MRTCPRCKLVSPEDAERCDCGYEFATGEVRSSYVVERDDLQVGKEVRVLVLLLIALQALALLLLYLVEGRFSGILLPLAWAATVYYLAVQFSRRKRWARTALAMLTLPIGLFLFTKRYGNYLEAGKPST